jgi:hypothetical protein
MRNRLSLERLLLIAEATLGVPYRELERMICPFRAELALAAGFARVCGAFLFPDPVDQAAVCAWLLIRTRPLPMGNQVVGYECMREMLVLAGCRWYRPEEDADAVIDILERVENHEADLAEFIRWVRLRATA